MLTVAGEGAEGDGADVDQVPSLLWASTSGARRGGYTYPKKTTLPPKKRNASNNRSGVA